MCQWYMYTSYKAQLQYTFVKMVVIMDKLQKLFASSFAREVYYVSITLTIYIMVGISRHYYTFLFFQLDTKSSIALSNDQKSWIAASIGTLCPIGCILSGTLMDVCGRKLYLILMFTPFIVSWLIIALSNSFPMFLVAGITQSLGGGMSLCVSTYISEIATAKHRGLLLGLTQVAYSLGAVLCSSIMYALPWNVAAFVFAAASSLCLLLAFNLPESPVWLYSKGNTHSSIYTLCKIRATTEQNLHLEIQEIDKFCTFKVKTSFRTVLKNCAKAWKPLIIIVALTSLLMHTGFTVFVAYTIMLLDQLKLPFQSTQIAVAYSYAGLVGSITNPFFMHLFARKTFLAISTIGMGLCMLTVTVYEEVASRCSVTVFGWFAAGAVCLYSFACNVGARPITLIVGGEIFPQEVSGMMNGVYGAICYGYWVVIVKEFPFVFSFLGTRVILWFFCGSCIAVTLYELLILPETKGKTLNEVQEQYFRKKAKQGSNMSVLQDTVVTADIEFHEK